MGNWEVAVRSSQGQVAGISCLLTLDLRLRFPSPMENLELRGKKLGSKAHCLGSDLPW